MELVPLVTRRCEVEAWEEGEGEEIRRYLHLLCKKIKTFMHVHMKNKYNVGSYRLYRKSQIGW